MHIYQTRINNKQFGIVTSDPYNPSNSSDLHVWRFSAQSFIPSSDGRFMIEQEYRGECWQRVHPTDADLEAGVNKAIKSFLYNSLRQSSKKPRRKPAK